MSVFEELEIKIDPLKRKVKVLKNIVIILSVIFAGIMAYNMRKLDFNKSYDIGFLIGYVGFSFLMFPLIGFIIGLFISLIPYKNYSYKQRYLYYSLITTIIIFGLLILLTTISFSLDILKLI